MSRQVSASGMAAVTPPLPSMSLKLRRPPWRVNPRGKSLKQEGSCWGFPKVFRAQQLEGGGTGLEQRKVQGGGKWVGLHKSHSHSSPSSFQSSSQIGDCESPPATCFLSAVPSSQHKQLPRVFIGCHGEISTGLNGEMLGAQRWKPVRFIFKDIGEACGQGRRVSSFFRAW